MYVSFHILPFYVYFHIQTRIKIPIYTMVQFFTYVQSYVYSTYFSSHIATYLKICQRKFGYSHNFWLLKNSIPRKLIFFQIFFAKKKRHFHHLEKDNNLKFLQCFETLLLLYNNLKFVFSYKVVDFLLTFHCFNFFLIQSDIDTVNNFAIFFDPQDPLSLQSSSANFFDPQEPFQDIACYT